MLEELKNLNTPCGKKEILYLLTKVLGKKSISKKDIKILFSHTPGMKIDVDATIKYCLAFSWICDSHGISINENLLGDLDNDEYLNSKLIDYTVRKLFDEGYLCERSFSFTLAGEGFLFRNELFPLELSAIRDVLVDQGFLVAKRTNQTTHFYVAKKYEKFLSGFLKDSRIKLTLEELKKKLAAEALAGDKAEKFVLAFEKSRLNRNLAEKVRLISEIDVCAGYDIISFQDDSSSAYDCFIEVKAVSRELDFFWSQNERETSKRYGECYKIYLVDLSQVSNRDYKPYIISNPYKLLLESDEWMMEPQSFHIKKVL